MFNNKLICLLLCLLGVNWLLGASNVFAACLVSTEDTQLCETREILFSSNEAISVSRKAAQLGSPVKIYEYLRNNAEYAVYHGARSSSLNTVLSMRGNDVDLASALAAMLRSQGIKTRYAVGDIQLTKAEVANWLGVINNDLAVAIMRDQGVQNIDDTDPSLVTFQHVWVEALLDYDNYRAGNTVQSVSCAAEGGSCKWVPLDVSFKQKQYKNTYRMLLRNVNFDYDAYYNAENPASPSYQPGLKDKNPLEIFEAQALEYLRTNHPGVTLEDVIDQGQVITDESGLLPASMPYEVIGGIVRYDSVQDYDAANQNTIWTKYLRSKIVFPACPALSFLNYTVPLAELSTKQLTVTLFQGSTAQVFGHRLDGIPVGSSITAGSITCGGITIGIGSIINVDLEMDAVPGEPTIKTTYENLLFGGYYLIATGGETSNWTQVKRAYGKLLEANQQYPILVDTDGVIGDAGIVYVDENGDGIVDIGDTPLQNHLPAQDALTGGLLYVAQSIYYTRLREESNRYSRLKGIKSPVSGYLGIVSTTQDVEYLDNVPFAVTPGGLLIDLKGIRLNGSWEIDQAATYSNETFKFIGHLGSSLEHEVWQEITGYDAISTMRGIQMALSSGEQLLDVNYNPPSNTFPTAIFDLGFTNSAPPDFTQNQWQLFGLNLVTWAYTGTDPDPGFNAVLPDASGVLATDIRAYWLNYGGTNGLDGYVASIDDVENQLLALPPGVYEMVCNGTAYINVPSVLLTELENCFNETITNAGMTDTVNFLDMNNGFVPANHAYRSYAIGIDEYGLGFMQTLRSSMYFVETPNAWIQYLLPTRFSQGHNYLFNVYIKNIYASQDLVSSTYAIVNHSNRLVAGGGYVTAEETTDPATSVEFNNEVFTDLNLVSVTNNDVIRTPSTADPVSTVTGNMYHDETDVVIKGRGLNYAFTRTYNSDQTRSLTATGLPRSSVSDLPLSKGWTHSYNMRLISHDYGQFPNYTSTQAPENGNGTTSSITYIDERGGESSYLIDDVGATWAVTPPRMIFDNLQLDTPTVGSYTITFRNEVKYVFTGSDLKVPGNTARLVRIEDPYGNQLNFTYNGNGQLAGISDNTGIAGRTGLILAYYPVGDVNAGHLQSIGDWTGRTWTYQYTNGQLTGVTNPLTNSITYSYQPDTDLLKDIVSPEDRGGKQKTTTFSYYENDQAYSYIDQLGNIELLTYDLFRKRTRITNPRGFITEHYYDENGALIKLVEPDKGILLFENNADGLRYLKRDALGNPTTYSYNSARTLDGAATDTFGQVTREQDALGNTIDYSYGIFDQITDVKNKNNINTAIEYYTVTDIPNGALRGKLQRVVMPQATINGAVQTNVVIAEYQYNADGTVSRIEELIDPAQPARRRITDLTYVYDANGFTLASIVSGATGGGSVTGEQRYDALWRLQTETVYRRTSATDATQIALTTSYEYDALNRPIKVTDPLGNISETLYDRNGQVSQITKRYALTGTNDRPIHSNCTVDAAYPNHHSCVVTTRSYDAADRLTSQSNLNGDTVSYEYNAIGKVTKITNARGHSLYNEYDQNGRLSRVTNENGYSVQSKYDLAGRLIATIDPNGNAMTYEYDAIGRRTKITTPENRITMFDEYDGNGNLIKMRDANAVSGNHPVNAQGATQYKQYDEFNRVILETNTMNEATSYTYDLLGNLTQVTDAKGQVTRFVYDDLGRLAQTIDPIIETPADATKTYSYDEVGNILIFTDRNGEVVRTTYDRLNRATLVEFLADATTQTAAYNQYGELTAIGNESVTYTYGYDNLQRMTGKTDSRTGKSLSWAYDNVGNLTSKTDYQGQQTQFTYDDTNRLVAMANKGYLQASYHYDPAGRLLSRILSNGAATLYSYDKDSLLKKVTQRSANGTVIDERNFGHGDIGNITQVVITNGDTINYGYTWAYRLRSVYYSYSNSALNEFFTYDAVGNRTTVTTGGVTYHYLYNNTGNRLDEVRRDTITGALINSYEYDANGSRLLKRNGGGTVVQSNVYNQKRLIAQTVSGGVTTTYAYDPNEYRIQKVTNTDTNNYLLEGEHLEAVYDENDQLQASYLRGVVVDEIINGFERDANGKLQNRSYHHDQVNSVVALTDHTGASVQTKVYSSFGREISTTGTSGNTLSYTGREFDGESSLYYYRARYYDPEIGRFLSEDPLGFRAGVNFYAYVGNNPLNFNDPSGNLGAITTIMNEFAKGDQAVSRETAIGVSEFSSTITLGGAGLGVSPFIAAPLARLGGAALEAAVISDLSISAGAAIYEFGQGSSLALTGAYAASVEFLVNNPLVISETVAFAESAAPIGAPTLTSTGAGLVGWSIFNSETAVKVPGEIGESLGNLYDTIDNLGGGTGQFECGACYRSDFGSSSSSAGGGFVLYPGKTNTNMLSAIYAK